MHERHQGEGGRGRRLYLLVRNPLAVLEEDLRHRGHAVVVDVLENEQNDRYLNLLFLLIRMQIKFCGHSKYLLKNIKNIQNTSKEQSKYFTKK